MDCADDLFCVVDPTDWDKRCFAGVEGDPCDGSSPCSDDEPFCVFPATGMGYQRYDGSREDPCSSEADCSAEAEFCITIDNACHDGSEGDPCDRAADCLEGDGERDRGECEG